MGTRDCLLILVALGLASLMVPRSTQAQAWLSDRGRAEGRGIRSGDLEFHPGVGLEAGYDSNVFLEDNSPNNSLRPTASRGGATVQLYTNETPDPAVDFRLTPHLFVSTLGRERLTEGGTTEYVPPKFAFRGGASGSIYYMVGVDRSLTQYVPVRGEGVVDLAETILPEKPFSLGFTQEGSLRRVPLQSNPAYQWHGGLGVNTEFGPKGGLLRAKLGYMLAANAYSSYGGRTNIQGYDLSYNDNVIHKLQERVSWKFLPKTALFQDAELDLQSYRATGSTVSRGSDKYNNGRVLTRFGANGAFTKELSTTIAAGYGGVFFSDGFRNADDVVLQAIINWNPSERVGMHVGYGRTIESSLLGNTKRINDINAGLKVNAGGVFLVGLNGALKFVDYGTDYTQQSIYANYTGLIAGESRLGYTADTSRNDVVLDLDLNGEYRLSDWFAITGQLGYLQNFTKYAFIMENRTLYTDQQTGQVFPGGQTLVSPAAYQNISVMLGVRAFL